MSDNAWLRWRVKYGPPLLGLVILLCTLSAVAVIGSNVRDLEHSRYLEHRELAANIAETSQTFILNKQYDYFYEVVKLLTTIPFIRFIALDLDGQRVLQAGDLRGLPPDDTLPGPGALPRERVDRARRLLVIRQPLTYDGAQRAFMAIGFSLRELQRALRAIYLAFGVILILLTGLGLYGYFFFRSEAVKSKMITAISHDAMHSFNPIYSRIYNVLDQQGGRVPVSELRRVLKNLRENTNAIRRVLENLKDNERLSKGEVKRLPRDTNLLKWVRLAGENFAETLAEKNMRLTLTQPAFQPVARADEEIVKSVLLNLFDNAIKYSRPGGEIRVWFELRGARIQVNIADQGRGLDRREWKRIFKPFVRIQPPGEKIEGSGLGLSNSRQLLRLLGGDLDIAESRPGGGTTFFFTLPAASKEEA